ncbi:MAG: hypothetical protein AAFO77_11445, partial [Pseudomonadota bacterium]
MTDLTGDAALPERTRGGMSLTDPTASWLAAMCGCVAFALIQVATYAPGGFPSSDDMLRLVHAQDLLNGHAWYDPVQYRLGLDGGTVMHWSKLVDAPIALLLAIGGDTFARFAWPVLLSFFALAGIATGAIGTVGRGGLFPAMVIGVAALWSIGIFSVGAFDHHNVQAVLLIWAVALLVHEKPGFVQTCISGAACALMMAIGMETLPYVAALGLWVAAAFAIGAVDKCAARGFGIGLAGTTLALFPILLTPAHWISTTCDAFSSFHLTLAVSGGGGLAAASWVGARVLRWAVLASVGACGAVIVLGVFSHCIANPLGALPPLLRAYWLEGVLETRSVMDVFASDPFSLIGYFGMALTALALCVAGLRRKRVRVSASLLLLTLMVAVSVTIWQQRGFMFAAVLAVFPMAYAVTKFRTIYEETRAPTALAGMVFFWIASINVVWFITGAQMASAFSSTPTLNEKMAAADPRDYCYDPDLYAVLNKEPNGVVLSSTNVGPMILLHTDHRAIAGPYHRNVDGNMLLINAMLAHPFDAKRMMLDNGVTHIADCVRGPDAADFKRGAPDGFQAQMHADPG